MKNVEKSNEMLIKAVKTSIFYRMKPENNEILLHNNVTKTYRKIDDEIADNIEFMLKNIAEELDCKERTFHHTQRS